MYRRFIFISLFLISSFSLLAQAPEVTNEPSALDKARERYREKVIEFQTEYAETLTALPQEFRKRLLEIKDSYFDSGNLEAGSAVGKEMERFTASRESITDKDRVREHTNLRIAQQWYIDAPKTAENIKNQKIAVLTKEYVEVLERLKEKLTKGRKIEEAFAVNDEIEAVKKVVPINLAEEPTIDEPFAPKPTRRPNYVPPREVKNRISTDGLVLYYPFDRNEGDKVTDQGNVGNHGKVYGAKWTLLGKNGGGYEFDGKDDYIDAGKGSSFKLTGEITIALWVFRKNENSTHYRLLSRSHLRNADFGLSIKPNNNIGTFVYSIDKRAAVTLNNSDSSGFIPLKKWTHVVSVFNGRTLKAFIDGELTLNSPAPRKMGISKKSPNIYIGRLGWAKKWNYEFNGILDDVMIYNRALSDEEVMGLYQATGGS